MVNFMKEWKETTLGDVCNIKHGYGFKGEFFCDFPTKNILLTPGNFNIGGGFKSDKLKYYDGPIPDEFILKSGDIIVTMTDLSKEGDTLGYSAKIPQNPNLIYLHNQRIGLINDINENIDSDFLYWLLRNKEYQYYVVSTATGSTVRHTSPNTIKKYKFKIPPINIQKNIGQLLNSIEEKIELNSEINNNLLELSNSIFLINFKNFNNYKEEDLKYTEIGFIPHNWDLLSLKEISDVAIGKTPPRKEQEWFSTNPNDIKWVSIKDLGNSGTFIFETSEYLTEEAVNKFNVKMIPKNTVLLSFKLTVGRIAITTENMVTNEAIAHFVLNEDNEISKEYLYLYLKNFNFESLGSTSSIAKAINSKIVKEIPVIIPNNNNIREFNLIVQPIFETIYKNQLEINKLTKLRDILLPKLMSGEIDVSNINFDLKIEK